MYNECNLLYRNILRNFHNNLYDCTVEMEDIKRYIHNLYTSNRLDNCLKVMDDLFRKTQGIEKTQKIDIPVIKTIYGNFKFVNGDNLSYVQVQSRKNLDVKIKNLDILLRLYQLELLIKNYCTEHSKDYTPLESYRYLWGKINIPADIINRFCAEIYKELVKNNDTVSLKMLQDLYSKISPSPLITKEESRLIGKKLKLFLIKVKISNKLKTARLKEIKLLVDVLDPQYPRMLLVL